MKSSVFSSRALIGNKIIILKCMSMLIIILGNKDKKSHTTLQISLNHDARIPKEGVYRFVSVAEAGNQKESKECIRNSLPCNGTHRRSGCTPAEPYPPVSMVIVLPCVA